MTGFDMWLARKHLYMSRRQIGEILGIGRLSIFWIEKFDLDLNDRLTSEQYSKLEDLISQAKSIHFKIKNQLTNK